MDSRKFTSNGFSLIEVLVSVIIIAVGLLGIAALQSNAIRFNHSAELRSIAVLQANNMVDRLYANSPGVKAGSYNNLSGIPSSPGCTICSPAEIATIDIHDWNTTNAALLPSGQGTVVRTGSKFTITVRWDGIRSGATGTACSGDLDVDLSCLIVEVQL